MTGKKNNKRKKSNITLTLAVVLAALIAVNIFVLGTLKSNTTPGDTVNLRKAPQAQTEDETSAGNISYVPENYTTVDINSEEIHFGELILVNNDNAFVSDGVHSVVKYETPANVYASKTQDYFIKDTTIYLNPTVIENINAMFADYVEYSGDSDILINAAYRTVEEQESIYAEKGPDIAANPGYSEHHSGYAFDICIYADGVYKTFADEGHYTWIPENCKKYGFIRRYPEGKSDITKISFEPWHYRYVGVPHSYYIEENGIVLEEYIDLLRHYTLAGEHLKIEAGGKNYEVYYVPASGETTKVYVPADKTYSVSGNNVDGFIVTVDMSVQTETQVSDGQEA